MADCDEICLSACLKRLRRINMHDIADDSLVVSSIINTIINELLLTPDLSAKLRFSMSTQLPDCVPWDDLHTYRYTFSSEIFFDLYWAISMIRLSQSKTKLLFTNLFKTVPNFLKYIPRKHIGMFILYVVHNVSAEMILFYVDYFLSAGHWRLGDLDDMPTVITELWLRNNPRRKPSLFSHSYTIPTIISDVSLRSNLQYQALKLSKIKQIIRKLQSYQIIIDFATVFAFLDQTKSSSGYDISQRLCQCIRFMCRIGATVSQSDLNKIYWHLFQHIIYDKPNAKLFLQLISELVRASLEPNRMFCLDMLFYNKNSILVDDRIAYMCALIGQSEVLHSDFVTYGYVANQLHEFCLQTGLPINLVLSASVLNAIADYIFHSMFPDFSVRPRDAGGANLLDAFVTKLTTYVVYRADSAAEYWGRFNSVVTVCNAVVT